MNIASKSEWAGGFLTGITKSRSCSISPDIEGNFHKYLLRDCFSQASLQFALLKSSQVVEF